MLARLSVKSRQQALVVLSRVEALKRRPKPNFVDLDFPEQAAFVNDNSPLSAALCTRRAGKSYGVGLKLFKKAYDFPGSTVLYLALTRDSAKRIMWRDVLKDIAKRRGIECGYNQTNLELTLPNGSMIKLAGADADAKEKEKFLGGKYPYVAVDEAGSFSTDLAQLIYEYLEPAVADYDGSIDLIGTPTIFWQGFFCQVTEGKENGWSLHGWNTMQNPHMEHWPKRLAMLKERNPRVEETPGYKRMYLGQWVKDLDALVYKFNLSTNLVIAEPDIKTMVGQVLGVDLGFNDATAYTLTRYYKHDNALYFVHAYKKSGQIVDDVVETLKSYIEKYNVVQMVFDNASKQVVETIRARFELWDVVIKAAKKTDKMQYIEIMNSDFITGQIKLVKDTTLTLQEEYQNLIKDPNSIIPKEHPGCENHLCDSGLYAWREARNYMEGPAPIKINEEERIERELEQKLVDDLRKQDEDFSNPFDDMEFMQ